MNFILLLLLFFFGSDQIQYINFNFYDFRKINAIENTNQIFTMTWYNSLTILSFLKFWTPSTYFTAVFDILQVVFIFISFIQIRKWLETWRKDDKITFGVMIRDLKIHVIFSNHRANNISSDNNVYIKCF